ncbi:response regulator transcription factor, partial [Saccharopolyspora sp. 7B]|uniref:response regulator transcription factor n=1 Tax=Saccharopolyspora sp. 7B TaxID=2877240 RepID=UPI0035B396E3|nr:hypothetical protein [Saccharopolyspora sp. 7B]
MGDGSTRVLLGDDHAIFVDALVSALSARGFPVVGTAGSIAATVAAVRRLAPDICLLDRFFGDGDGVAGGGAGGGGGGRGGGRKQPQHHPPATAGQGRAETIK